MTNEERIERLEQIVKTLAETIHSLTTIINTGRQEYSLSDVRYELEETPEFKLKPIDAHDHSRYLRTEDTYRGQVRAPQCIGEWHTAVVQIEPWCSVCGRSR